MELAKGYYTFHLAKEDIHKSAVITPFGLFEYIKMPFGLRNAAQTFHIVMDNFFIELDFVFVYLDDLLIASNDEEEHSMHIWQVCIKVQQHDMVINPEKCVFGKEEITFFGHKINKQGIQPTPKKIQIIKDFTNKPQRITKVHWNDQFL